MRLFVAVELTPGIRRAIIDFAQQGWVNWADVKWVNPEHLHLTLKFLGEVPEKKVPRIQSTLETLASTTRRFSCEVKGASRFPSLGIPRVLWVGFSRGAVGFTELAKRVNETMKDLGFPPEERAFSPHITVGRLRSPIKWRELTKSWEGSVSQMFGSMTVRSIVLMKSQLTREGPVYTPIKNIELRIK